MFAEQEIQVRSELTVGAADCVRPTLQTDTGKQLVEFPSELKVEPAIQDWQDQSDEAVGGDVGCVPATQGFTGKQAPCPASDWKKLIPSHAWQGIVGAEVTVPAGHAKEVHGPEEPAGTY